MDDNQEVGAVIACSEDSQAAYEETPYEDASWPVVGEVVDNSEFAPMDLNVVHGDGLSIDPMFQDYGGVPTEEATQRWHLPEHLAAEIGKQAQKEEEDEIPKVILTEEELEVLKQEAFAAGKQEGIEETVLEKAEKFAMFEEGITGMLRDMHKQVEEAIAEVEKKSVQFALDVSKKIIDTTVEINPEYIVEIVREASVQSGTAVIRKIRVSPQDMEFIEIIGAKKLLPESEGGWDFEADPEIKAGCVVETSAGEIDYQLDAGWERIKEKVLKVTR